MSYPVQYPLSLRWIEDLFQKIHFLKDLSKTVDFMIFETGGTLTFCKTRKWPAYRPAFSRTRKGPSDPWVKIVHDGVPTKLYWLDYFLFLPSLGQHYQIHLWFLHFFCFISDFILCITVYLNACLSWVNLAWCWYDKLLCLHILPSSHTRVTLSLNLTDKYVCVLMKNWA